MWATVVGRGVLLPLWESTTTDLRRPPCATPPMRGKGAVPSAALEAELGRRGIGRRRRRDRLLDAWRGHVRGLGGRLHAPARSRRHLVPRHLAPSRRLIP